MSSAAVTRDELRPDRAGTPPAWTGIPTRVRCLLLLDLLVALAYVTWWLIPGRMGSPPLFWALVAAECFTVLHVLGLWSAIWSTRVDAVPPLRTAPTVDVLIPTYGEPLEVLEATIAAAVAMDHPHLTWVLDDAARPEVELLADELGARYVTRTSNRGAKAGNINNALRRSSGDLVAVFDADHVPARDFLTTLLGHFEDPTVGFVQSPQLYANGAVEAVARGAYQQQAIFYGPIMRGKNGQGAAFCCGTNVIFRRAALAETGGLVESSVVEDFVTSIHLHRRAWRSVYHPYALAAGMGPATVATYFKQQFRWARGSVGALFTGEPFKPGLTLRQRAQYLLATSFYLTGLVTGVYVALPIAYLMFGYSAFSDTSGSFALFYAPYLLLGLFTIRVGLGGQLRLAHLQYTFGTFPVYAVASLAALLRLPSSFGVTSKSTDGKVRPPALAWVTVGVAALTAAAMGYGVLAQPWDARMVTNLAWAAINLLLLSAVVRVTLTEAITGRVVPVRRSAPEALDLTEAADGPSRSDRSTSATVPERALGVPGRRPTIAVPWRPATVVGVLTALGAAIRLGLTPVQSLWLDEALTLQQASWSPVTIWRYQLEENVHVPLYHTVVHYWIDWFGTSETALRMPSVIFGTACVPLLYLVARRIIGTNPALIATGIGATAPLWIWHATEARMYSMMLFLALASTALLLAALDAGDGADAGNRRRVRMLWAAYAVVTATSFYTHYYDLLLPAVHLLWVLAARAGRRQVIAWFLASAAAAFLFAPWVVALVTVRLHSVEAAENFSTGLSSQASHQGVFGVVFGWLTFAVVLVFGYHGTAVLAAITATVFGAWPLFVVRGILSGGLAAWVRSPAAVFLVGWATFMIGAVYLLDLVRPGAWMQRYLIVASVPLVLMLATAVSNLVRRQTVALALVVLAGSTLTLAQSFESQNPVRQNFRAAAATLSEQTRPGDVVLVEPLFNKTVLNYYLDPSRFADVTGRRSSQVALTPGVRVIGVGSNSHPANEFLANEMPAVLASVPAGGHVWVLTQYEETVDEKGLLRGTIAGNLGTDRYQRFGAELRLTGHPSTGGEHSLTMMTVREVPHLASLEQSAPGS